MLKNQKGIVILIMFVIVLVSVSVVVFHGFKDTPLSETKKDIVINDDLKNNVKQDNLLVYSDGEYRKVKIADGEIENSSPWDLNDFSGFQGFPIMDNLSEQIFALKSLDNQKALVRITTSASDGNMKVNDFICEIGDNKCIETNLTDGKFEGLEQGLKEINSTVIWSKWDDQSNRLLGIFVNDDLGVADNVYACELNTKKCEKINKEDGYNVLIPENSFALSSKIVAFQQDGILNEEMGNHWELVIYDLSNLREPMKKYDISSLIDRNENESYDAVQSVFPNKDETLLAIGTNRRISILNLESGSSEIVYNAPLDEEGDYYWDASSLFMTPDAKYISFVDTNEFPDDDDENALSENETNNVLKKIDLQNDNIVTAMYQGNGLRVER